MSKVLKDNDCSDDDVWDDTLLIKAYDNSVKLAKEELAKRIAQSTNKQHNKNDKSSGSECPSKDSVQNGFKVDDYVRATYEDGVDYEAKIVAIDELSGKCLLKYVGYENEQHVNMSELVPSWGKKARRKQFATAKQNQDVDMPTTTTAADEQSHKKSKAKDGTASRSNPMFDGLPPPPPMPPMLNDVAEDSEHLSAMLMSWYMSGYYTGLYHGQRIAKNKSKTTKNLL